MIDKADYALGMGALSSPLWLQLLEEYLQGYILLVGGIVITVRAAIAVREWWRGR